jgi:hypothetical protein
MKKILNESQKRALILEREKAIVENFSKTFNKIKRIDENEVNEYGRFDYDREINNDPRAPFNQVDQPEFKSFEILDDSNVMDEIYIQLKNEAGGTSIASLENILMGIKASPEDVAYFQQAIQMNPRPQDFMARLESVVEQYAQKAEFGGYPENY